MKNFFTYTRFLTDQACGWLFSLTLFFTLLIQPQGVLAFESGENPATMQGFASSSPYAVDIKAEKDKRIGQLLDYLRNEAPRMIPSLPSAIRAPARWAMDGMNAIRDEFDFSGTDFSDVGALGHMLKPVASLLRTPDETALHAHWLSASYRHKGFLPTHDAIVLGFNSRHSMANDMLQLHTKPFYGQNWHSPENFWGIETTLAIGQRHNDNRDKPWGTVSLRYTNGDDTMLDHGHGVAMRTAINFTNHLSLHAEMYESGESDKGNRVMLRWTLSDLSK